MTDQLQQVAIQELSADPRQPRKLFDQDALEELAASIRTQGILEPLLVRRQVRQDGKVGYTIVAGERRWRAARVAKLATVPAIVGAWTDAQVAEIQLVENAQREELTAIERATAYRAYLDQTKASLEQLAQRLGVTHGHISQYLSLLELPKPAQKWVADGTLTAAHGRELARLVKYPELLEEELENLKGAITDTFGEGVPTSRQVKTDVDYALRNQARKDQQLKEKQAADAKAAKERERAKNGKKLQAKLARERKRELAARKREQTLAAKAQLERARDESAAELFPEIVKEQAPAMLKELRATRDKLGIPPAFLAALWEAVSSAAEDLCFDWSVAVETAKQVLPQLPGKFGKGELAPKDDAARRSAIAWYCWLADTAEQRETRLMGLAEARVAANLDGDATRVTAPARKGGRK